MLPTSGPEEGNEDVPSMPARRSNSETSLPSVTDGERDSNVSSEAGQGGQGASDGEEDMASQRQPKRPRLEGPRGVSLLI